MCAKSFTASRAKPQRRRHDRSTSAVGATRVKTKDKKITSLWKYHQYSVVQHHYIKWKIVCSWTIFSFHLSHLNYFHHFLFPLTGINGVRRSNRKVLLYDTIQLSITTKYKQVEKLNPLLQIFHKAFWVHKKKHFIPCKKSSLNTLKHIESLVLLPANGYKISLLLVYYWYKTVIWSVIIDMSCSALFHTPSRLAATSRAAQWNVQRDKGVVKATFLLQGRRKLANIASAFRGIQLSE